MQSAKNAYKCIKYVAKKGDYHAEGMDVDAELSARETHTKLLGRRLLAEPLSEVMKDEPELIFQYQKLKLNLEEYKRDLARSHLKDCGDFIPNTWDVLLPVMPELKKRHYWIWSREPDRGKTTWLKSLDNELKCSWITYDEKFQEINKDSQLILLDAYTVPHLKATTLERMCDGTYGYPCKGGL